MRDGKQIRTLEASRAERAAIAAKKVKALRGLKAKGLSSDEIFIRVKDGFSKAPAAFRGRKTSRRDIAKLLRAAGESEFADEFDSAADAYNAEKAAERQAIEDRRQAIRDAKDEVRAALPKNPLVIRKLVKGLEDVEDVADSADELAQRLYTRIETKLSPEALRFVDPDVVLNVFLDSFEDMMEGVGETVERFLMKESTTIQGENMDYDDRVELLEEAGEQLLEVIDKVRMAVAGTRLDSRASAYIIPHLRSWIEDSNQQITIASMIAEFEEEIGPWDEEDEEDEDF